MTEKNEGMVQVKSHTRDGHKVQSYERSPPGKGAGITETGAGGFRIKIDSTIGNGSAQSAKDAGTVKDALNRFGYYTYPDYVTDRGKAEWMDAGIDPAIRSFQKDNGLPVNGRMRPDGNTVKAMNEQGPSMMDYAEYAATGATQGLSLGWADEIEGVAGGAGYAIGAAVTGRENPIDAAKRGYREYRDSRRAKLEEGREKAPILTKGAEFVGNVLSPPIVTVAKTAPASVKIAAGTKDAIAAGFISGIGSGEGSIGDYAKNIGLSVGGNLAGTAVGNRAFGRAGNYTARNLLREGTSTGVKEGASSTSKKRE